jgi:hypothetical protein
MKGTFQAESGWGISSEDSWQSLLLLLLALARQQQRTHSSPRALVPKVSAQEELEPCCTSACLQRPHIPVLFQSDSLLT